MRKYTSLLLAVIFFGCSDNDDDINGACGVTNPVEELTWLKAEIDQREDNPTEDMKYCYISQADFEGQTVFIYFDCNPLINKVFPIYNCDGNLLNNSTESEISFDELQNQKIIWKPDNFVCQVD